MRCGKIGIIMVMLIILLLGSGCGSNEQDAQQGNTVELGGQLVYGSLTEPNNLNPLLSNLLATSEVGSLIFDGLTTVNDKGEWVPDLAVEVPSRENGDLSPDGLTVTYRLRQGVTWHDGYPFTSDDVKFTWETIMNPKVNVISRDGYDKIVAVDTPDANTVVIHFREYYAPYLTLFPVILPEHILANVSDINTAQFNRAPVGTGPFEFKEWRIAEAIILEANPNYFRGKPNLDGIIYRILPDENIMLSQLKAGELDIVSNIDASQLEQVQAVDGVHVSIDPTMIWEHLDFNLGNSLFQDVQVRKAIALGIDRQAIINTVLNGVAGPAAGDQPPMSWAYDPALKIPPRDVNAARALLIKAGWQQGQDGIFAKGGQRLSFSLTTTAGNKIREVVAQSIAEQLNEVGIEVNVQLVDPTIFFNDVLKNRRFETAMFAWVAGIDPDDSNLWNSSNIPTGANGYQGHNFPGWSNPEVDSLTVQGQQALDMGSRREIYCRIQELLQSEVPVIPLYFRANIDAVRDTVVNYKPNPSQSGNLWNAWEWGLTKKQI